MNQLFNRINKRKTRRKIIQRQASMSVKDAVTESKPPSAGSTAITLSSQESASRPVLKSAPAVLSSSTATATVEPRYSLREAAPVQGRRSHRRPVRFRRRLSHSGANTSSSTNQDRSTTAHFRDALGLPHQQQQARIKHGDDSKKATAGSRTSASSSTQKASLVIATTPETMPPTSPATALTSMSTSQSIGTPGDEITPPPFRVIRSPASTDHTMAGIALFPPLVEEEEDPLFRKALEEPEDSADPEYRNQMSRAAAALDKSGNELFERGRYDEAFIRYERALYLKRRHLQVTLVQEAETKNQEAPQADDDDAVLLNCCQEHGSPRSSQKKSIMASVATSINNMTYLKQRSGQMSTDDTMTAYMQSLKIKREILGPDHLSVGKTLNNIGSVFYLKEEYDAALAAYREALRIMEAKLGSHHLDVVTVISNIGDVYYAKGLQKLALVEYRKALRIRWKALGKYDPKVTRLMEQIAAIETGKQPSKGDDELSDSEYEDFKSQDRRSHELFLNDVKTLQAELIEDIKYFDLVERKSVIDMIREKTEIIRNMKSMRALLEADHQEVASRSLDASQLPELDEVSDAPERGIPWVDFSSRPLKGLGRSSDGFDECHAEAETFRAEVGDHELIAQEAEDGIENEDSDGEEESDVDSDEKDQDEKEIDGVIIDESEFLDAADSLGDSTDDYSEDFTSDHEVDEATRDKSLQADLRPESFSFSEVGMIASDLGSQHCLDTPMGSHRKDSQTRHGEDDHGDGVPPREDSLRCRQDPVATEQVLEMTKNDKERTNKSEIDPDPIEVWESSNSNDEGEESGLHAASASTAIASEHDNPATSEAEGDRDTPLVTCEALGSNDPTEESLSGEKVGLAEGSSNKETFTLSISNVDTTADIDAALQEVAVSESMMSEDVIEVSVAEVSTTAAASLRHIGREYKGKKHNRSANNIGSSQWTRAQPQVSSGLLISTRLSAEQRLQALNSVKGRVAKLRALRAPPTDDAPLNDDADLVGGGTKPVHKSYMDPTLSTAFKHVISPSSNPYLLSTQRLKLEEGIRSLQTSGYQTPTKRKTGIPTHTSPKSKQRSMASPVVAAATAGSPEL